MLITVFEEGKKLEMKNLIFLSNNIRKVVDVV